jgi:hypothetical protein
MKKITSLSNTISFGVDSDYMVVLNENQFIKLYSSESLDEVKQFRSSSRLDNRIYINNSVAWANTLYDAKGLIIHGTNSVISDNFVKYCTLEYGNIVIYEIIDVNGPEVFQKIVGQATVWHLNEVPFVFKIISNYFLYKKNPLLIKALNNETGQDIWVKQLPEPFSQFLGLSIQTVWITLDSGRILGLNLRTGEEEYNLLKPNKYPHSWANQINKPTFYLGQYTQLDQVQNKLFGLREWYYWEIDLANPTQSYFLYDLEEHFRAFQMEANMPGYTLPFEGDHVFFGSIDRKGPTIGTFDRQTHQIVWASGDATSDNYLPSVRQMAYQHNKLYVLDGRATLHIFERE